MAREKNDILTNEIHYPDSLGLLYSATCIWVQVNSAEYKVIARHRMENRVCGCDQQH